MVEENSERTLDEIFEYAAKCGDVFLFDEGKFIFACYFCDEKVIGFGKFIDHIHTMHFKILNENGNARCKSDTENSAVGNHALLQNNDKNQPRAEGGGCQDEFVEYVEVLSPSQYEEPEETETPVKHNSWPKHQSRADQIRMQEEEYEKNKEVPKFQCNQCNRKFASNFGLNIHKHHHSMQQGEEKTLNKRKRPLEDVAEPVNLANVHQSIVFLEESDLQNSLDILVKDTTADDEEETIEEIPKYQCDRCERKFATKFGLNVHKNHHILMDSDKKKSQAPVDPPKPQNPKLYSVKPKNPPKYVKNPTNPWKIFHCNYCDMYYKSELARDIHQKLHNRTPISSISIEQSEMGKYKCSFCPTKFSTIENLSNHMKACHKTALLKCGSCEAVFLTKEGMNDHVKKSHPTSRPYQCNDCEMSFTCKSNLNIHQGQAHGKVIIPMCKICHKKFISLEKLKSHMMSHTK